MAHNNGIVYLIGAGPGDPGLLTLRGVQCLECADVVVYDRLANPALLAHARQAERIDVGKKPHYHPVPQVEINRILVEQAKTGKTVARLKGGDPFVFGRGGEEALALYEAGIPFEIVPGVSSGIAAPAYAGIPVTQRGVAASVAFITGHESETSEDDNFHLEPSLCGADTLVFFMGVRNLDLIIKGVLASGRPAETPVAIIQRGTSPAQKVVTGTLANICEQVIGIQSPAITVVGEVVKYHETLNWFDRQQGRPLLGVRVLNTRPADSEDGDELDRRLTELGAVPIRLPAIQVDPAPDSLPLMQAIEELASRPGGAAPYDWIIFTSSHAVISFFNQALKMGYDARLLFGVKLAVIGQRTSDKLRQYGLKADFLPANANGKNLAAEIPDIAARRILVPCSAIAPPDLSQALLQRGAFVNRVTAYTVTNVNTDDVTLSRLREGGMVDAVIFFSPSAVNGLKNMLGDVFLSCALDGCMVVCVGQTTAEAVELAGLKVAGIAAEASINGILEELTRLTKMESFSINEKSRGNR